MGPSPPTLKVWSSAVPRCARTPHQLPPHCEESLSRSQRAQVEQLQAALASATAGKAELGRQLSELGQRSSDQTTELDWARAQWESTRRERRALQRKLWRARLGEAAGEWPGLLVDWLVESYYLALALGVAALVVFLALYGTRSPIFTRLGLVMPAEFHSQSRSSTWAPPRR